MALSAELEALLAKIEDKTIQEATKKQLIENQENGLRQADYSKKQNELKAERDKLQGEWKKHIDWYDSAKAQYDKAIEEQSTLQARIQELENIKSNVAPENLDEGELNKQIKLAQDRAEAVAKEASKLNTQYQELDKMIKEGKLITADKFEEAVNRKADGLANIILDVWDKQQAYTKEFGKELPRQTLISEMAKFQGNIEAAYESLTKQDREDKLRKDIEAEVEKKFQDRLKQAGLPIDQGSTSPSLDSTMGPLQRKAMGIKEESIPEDVAADGSGRLGYLIAQEMIKEGKDK